MVRNLDYLLFSYNTLSQEKINNKEELIKILVVAHFFKRNNNSFLKKDKIIKFLDYEEFSTDSEELRSNNKVEKNIM